MKPSEVNRYKAHYLPGLTVWGVITMWGEDPYPRSRRKHKTLCSKCHVEMIPDPCEATCAPEAIEDE